MTEMTEMTDIEVARLEALRSYLRDSEGVAEDELADIDAESYDETSFDANGGTYRVLLDDEADDAVVEETGQLLWAFNASFLVGFMPDGIGESEIDAIRGDRCEDANDAILALVRAGGFTVEEVAGDYASADGRGHALAGYDHEENEVTRAGRTWYIYRTN